MSGPATEMHQELLATMYWRCPKDCGCCKEVEERARRTIGDITPAQLAAMDAAAEVMADPTLDPEGRDLHNLPMTVTAERRVLRVLLDRAAKRREGGHG